MNGYKKLWYGGYGKYNYYTVAEDKGTALQQLRNQYNLHALPIDCKEIDNIDGYIVVAINEAELKEPEEEQKEKAEINSVSEMSRNELIQLAKELGIDGKIATFKTEDLREKVGERLEAISKESGRSE